MFFMTINTPLKAAMELRNKKRVQFHLFIILDFLLLYTNGVAAEGKVFVPIVIS